jgi:hypothetical protein
VRDGIALPKDKYKSFEGMCQFPLATTALCGSIFDELSKVFTAQDSFWDVEMLDDTLKSDYREYLDSLKVNKYFETEGFEAYRKRPCCLYVVDIAQQQTSSRPEPYFREISIRQIHDIGVERMQDGNKRIGFVIFKEGKDQYRCFDDMNYRLFTKTQGGEFRLDVDVVHGLGYTPAEFLISSALYDDDDESPVARKTPISDSLGDLDWLLAYKVFERMYETYGPFPIMTIPDTKCTYIDHAGNHCMNGVINIMRPDGTSGVYSCPACEKNSVIGPGTVFSRAVPVSKDQPQLGNAVEFTPAQVDSLDFITKKIDYLEREIFANNVGDSDTTITTEAVNEKQVQANVEGRRSVLGKIKKDFEHIKKFLIDTMGRLRYADYYVSATINMGEQWLLLSADELTLQYMDAKKAGLPVYLVNQKKQQYVQTEYRNNPTVRQRAALLEMLEPWPDLSISECVTYQLNVQFPEKFFLKLDFTKFISKFETANTDIVQWGSALSLDKKIEKLTEILLKYGKEESAGAKPLPEPGAGSGSSKTGKSK